MFHIVILINTGHERVYMNTTKYLILPFNPLSMMHFCQLITPAK
jgi:hypothetical protein